MTIGIGFLCSDGVVICADRQMTGAGFKFEDSKIYIFYAGESVFAFTYAGDPDAARMMLEKSKEALYPVMARASEFENFGNFVSKALEPVFRDRQSKEVQSLIGGVAYNEPFLIKTKGTKVVSASADYIGFGDSSVLRYVCDLLLPSEFNVSEAQILASYLVSVAGRYVQYCGDTPDHAVIRNDRTLVTGTSGPWPDAKQRFRISEVAAGKALRGLLLSAGTAHIEIV